MLSSFTWQVVRLMHGWTEKVESPGFFIINIIFQLSRNAWKNACIHLFHAGVLYAWDVQRQEHVKMESRGIKAVLSTYNT